MNTRNESPLRYTSYPLPKYSYVTGHFPHPLRDPRGHGCPGPPEPTEPITDENWQSCETYLWAVDLFNTGFYWESHEAWEAAWHAVGRSGVIADFLKSLIKFAAAGVKAREGRVTGVQRHGKRAAELLTQVAGQSASHLLGLSLEELHDDACRMVRNAEEITRLASRDLAGKHLPVTLQLLPH